VYEATNNERITTAKHGHPLIEAVIPA